MSKVIKVKVKAHFLLISVIFLCNYFVNTNQQGTGQDCNVKGTLSGIVCVSEMEYKLEIYSSEAYSCWTGAVCANDPRICVSDMQPACKSSRCRKCLPGAGSTCVRKDQYAYCDEYGNLSNDVSPCPVTEPFCSVTYQNGLPTHICTATTNLFDCIDDPTPPPPPQHDVCTNYGVFGSKTDPTCKRYYYCSYSNGQLVKNEYVCEENS